MPINPPAPPPSRTEQAKTQIETRAHALIVGAALAVLALVSEGAELSVIVAATYAAGYALHGLYPARRVSR